MRFIVGGLVVSVFAVLGDLFRPKSFAGLFDAAPSVALASLALAVGKDGALYASAEARSMVAGAIALLFYSRLAHAWLMRGKCSSLTAALSALPLWFGVAFGLWFVTLR